MNPEQWLSLKWNGGSTMSDRWLNQSKIIQRTTIRTFVLHLEEKGYVTTYQIGKYSYINYLIEEQDYKEQELEKTKNFWYKESGFELVKTLYKGKLNEGKLKKLKKLLEEIDD